MQITCEKCQTSYQVDDKLIPVAGAPVQCTKCGNLFTAYPPQAAAQARGPAKTVLMFAAEPAPSPAPGTQPPGAGLPQRAPSTPALAPAPKPATTAATFPAAAVPTPAAAPVAAAGPAATMAFGSPAAPPSAPHRPATQPPPASQKTPGPLPSQPVGRQEPQPTPAPLPQTFASLPAVSPESELAGVAAGAALDQPINTSRPGRMTQMFFSQGEKVEEANLAASKAASGEGNRKPGQTQMFEAASNFEQQLVRKSRAPLFIGLGAVAAVILVALAAIFVKQLLGPPGADRQAVKDHDAAMVLLSKDDPEDLVAADKAFAAILSRKPHYVEAEADRALALRFLADDRLWQAERLKASYDGLYKQVQQPLEPAQRTKAVEAMTSINRQYEALGQEAKNFENLSNKLVDAGKDDPKNPAVLRARGFQSADLDRADDAQKRAKEYLHAIDKPRDGWAELMLAEADVAGKASEDKRQDGLGHVTSALAIDPQLVRARYLRVRLDTMNKKEAEAKDDVSALGAANPAHLGGASLLAGLEEQLAREKAEAESRAARQAAAQAQGQEPAGAKKKPAPRAAPRRMR